jgi:hypothetical protein
MVETNKTVNLIIKISSEKTFYFNKVKGYSITEGKIHFRDPNTNLLKHYPETWVGIEEVVL